MRISISLFLLFACSLLPVSAQQFKRIFLFEDFTRAEIRFRNNSISTASLNYDASNKTVLFLQGTDIMEITNVTQVDTITIKGRKFIPAAKGFYEVVETEGGTIYIDWLLKDVNIGSKGALGAVTQGSVHNLRLGDLGLNSTEMYTPYKEQKIGSTDIYRRKNDNTYYIKVNGKLAKIKTVKHLEKLFPAYKEVITSYVKENGINIKNAQDALHLLSYCLQLSKETSVDSMKKP